MAGQQLNIGDLVEAVSPYQLRSGGGWYDAAIVVHLHPVTVVSKAGDMLWQATLYPGCLRPIGQPEHDWLEQAKKRWNIARDAYDIDQPGVPQFYVNHFKY